MCRGLIVGNAVLVAGIGLGPSAGSSVPWVPEPDATWQYQLQGPIDTTVDADVYGVDLFDTPQSKIDQLHADGRHAVCYLSAGRSTCSYNTWLADAAHDRGLSVGLKNDLGQVDELEPFFDFAVNEQCFQYRECNRLQPFLDAGKNVIIIEYERSLDQLCGRAEELGAVAMRKRLSLKVWRRPCP